MQFAAVLVAAGSGQRAGAGLPKVWRRLAGKTVARWAAEGLLAAGASPLVVVVAVDCDALARDALAGLDVLVVEGGAARTESVGKGLEAVAARADAQTAVLIHDAARPLVKPHHVEALLQALQTADGAVPALPVSDTLKRQAGERVDTVSRDGLWRAQTPQAFRLSALLAARAAVPMVTRIGQGFDAHTFGPGDHVTLCGVEVAHSAGLVGHSDADAGLHALTDALLGAIGEADIGEHFPPSDPQWRGASSDRFLVHAVDLIRARGGRIVNVDVTLICEAPKVKPHRQAMRARLSQLLGLPLDRISVKATTTEGMGFTGRREGLAAQAIASVETPAEP